MSAVTKHRTFKFTSKFNVGDFLPQGLRCVDLYWHRGTIMTLDTELQMYIKPKTANTAMHHT